MKLYRHYKGGLYLSLFEQATVEKTKEPAVVYISLKTFKVWIRPAKDFHEEIAVAGASGWYVKRFEKVSLF
jgi:hypothetical protein